jgi:hypothetical protein
MACQVLNQSKEPLLLDFKSYNDTITANCYCQALQKLHTKINKNCNGKLNDDIILLHDHVHSHMTHKVQNHLNAM